MTKKLQPRLYGDSDETYVPSITVIEEDRDDDYWTGLLDQYGERIMYRRPAMGFFDFDLMRAMGLLPELEDDTFTGS